MPEASKTEKKSKKEIVRVTKSVKIKTSDLTEMLRLIEKHNQTDSFCRASKRAGAVVDLSADTANFIKKFVANRPILRNTDLGNAWMAASEFGSIFDIDFGKRDRTRRNTG